MSKTFWYLSPTRIGLDAPELDIRFLKAALTYEEPKVAGELKRLKKNFWYRQKHGEEKYAAEIARLNAALNVCLLEKRDDHWETMAGFAARLLRAGYVCTKELVAPRPGDDDAPLRWPRQRKPKNVPRYYQREAVDALMAARHAAVSLPTGSGKSDIIEELTHRYGRRTLIMAPGLQIAEQLYEQLVDAFGLKRVGYFGDGKKQSDKEIIIGIAASLTNAAGKHLENLNRVEVFIVDESHLCPATTFEKVCSSVAKNAIFRHFVSATQLRNDGTEVLLEGITGSVVYSKTLEELVLSTPQYLAKPKFFTVEVESHTGYAPPDWHTLANTHLWGNVELHRKAAQLANRLVDRGMGPVLILVDHVTQFQHLFGHLRHEVGFAHGPLTNEERAAEVPNEFQEVDVKALVNRFNAGKVPILVGTSCITTGTDLRPTRAILFLMCGESEIKVRQCIGRGTRLVEGKKDFIFVDFDIIIPDLKPMKNPFHRHWWGRQEFYKPWDVKKLPL